MTWTTFHLEVTTPLFNGGPDLTGGAGASGGGDGSGGAADVAAGIRVPSIRGAMRFWFRALAGMALGPDLAKLAEAEARVFGDSEKSSAGHDGRWSSPVALRLPSPPAAVDESRPDWLGDDPDHSRWIVYLLGQGLGDVRGVARHSGRRPVTKPHVRHGTRFDLQMRFAGSERASEEVAALAVAALWLTCAYGGVGARTRRGFGGLRITGAAGDLPEPWNHESVRTPDLGHYEQLASLFPNEPVGRSLLGLRALGHDVSSGSAWTDRPTFPVLHRTYTRAAASGGGSFGNAESVLAFAGEELRYFRARQDYPGAGYHPKIKTPEWETAIRGAGNRFPLGALGLPVVYKGRQEVHADRGNEKLRRASPLWLRPVGAGRNWRLLSFAFQGRFLPTDADPDLGVHLWRDSQRDKALTVDDSDVVDRTNDWIKTLHDGGTFVRPD